MPRLTSAAITALARSSDSFSLACDEPTLSVWPATSILRFGAAFSAAAALSSVWSESGLIVALPVSKLMYSVRKPSLFSRSTSSLTLTSCFISPRSWMYAA